MKPIDLYVVEISPPSRAVIIAAKYMNINFKLIPMDLMKNQQKEDWFVKMNPQHILPTMDDNGFILWESRAIMSYFANKYAPENPIYPTDPKQRGIVDRFLQYDLNVLNRVLGECLIPMAHVGKRKRGSAVFKNAVQQRKVTEALTYLDQVLSSNTFVAGHHLTLADFSVYCSLEFAYEYEYDFSRYRHIERYYHHLKQMLTMINHNTNNNVQKSGQQQLRLSSFINMNQQQNDNNNNNKQENRATATCQMMSKDEIYGTLFNYNQNGPNTTNSPNHNRNNNSQNANL